MRDHTKDIIQRIGETDQLFLQANSPDLALERGELRLKLVELSKSKQEQIHFLKEAIVLLEQGRIEFDEMPMVLYLDLSLSLARAYMVYFEISQEQRYALITQQIMKPLSKAEHGEIYFYLAYASAVKAEPAMTRHWLIKYCKSNEFNLAMLLEHSAFKTLHQEDWFTQLSKSKIH